MTFSKHFKNIFQDIPMIEYKGENSKDPLSFRYYDPSKKIGNKTMAEHTRYSICYWHNLSWGGNDMFGNDAFTHPWLSHEISDPFEKAELKADYIFELARIMQIPFYAWHDRDVIAEADTPKESAERLVKFSDYLLKKQESTGIQLLWGTANAFSHKRFSAGAGSNPNPEVFAYAASQVRTAMEVTQKLGGSNYVLWGGREGYETLLNTNIGQEQDQLGRFMQMVVEHKHKIGFTGNILIEPKPKEPTKHQYDFDVATVFGFLQKYGLEKEIKMNIETNHAILAGHTMEHEVAMADALGIFGSIDINAGDYLLGWDTDQFPTDDLEMAKMMYYILKAGGLQKGGLNFDAKLRRQSVDATDYIYAHVAGMDAGAHGLIAAHAMIEDKVLDNFIEQRYSGWKGSLGQDILSGKMSLEDVANFADQNNLNPQPISGRQEMLESIVSRYL